MVYFTLNHHLRIQRRTISLYLRDAWHAKSLRPSNPLSEELSSVYSNAGPLHCLGSVNPHHVKGAAHLTNRAGIKRWEKMISDLESYDIVDLLRGLNDVEAENRSCQQIVNFLGHMSGESDKPKWKAAAQHVADSLYAPDKKQLACVRQKMEQFTNTSHECEESSAAASLWLRSNPTELQDSDGQSLRASLSEIEENLIDAPPNPSRETLLNMYSYVGLQKEMANNKGFQTSAGCSMALRSCNLKEIRDLHRSVRDTLSPNLVESSTALNDLMRQSGKPATDYKRDIGGNASEIGEGIEISISLDRALFALNRVAKEVFDVELVEDTDPTVYRWSEDVRLFHLYKRADCAPLGSFYVDLYSRAGKPVHNFTSPLHTRGAGRKPLIGVSLSIPPPVWDTEPVSLSLHHVECLFHEFGHVLQYTVPDTELGAILGPERNTDWLEFLPKFLEKFVTDREALCDLLAHPAQGVSLEDAVDAVLRHRSRQKRLELTQLAFFGELELTLFHEFQLQETESKSMVALQSQIADEYVPHDKPAQNDIRPLLDILRENASGLEVARYRYLFAECTSAAVYEKWKQEYSVVPDELSKLREAFLNSFVRDSSPAKMQQFCGMQHVTTDSLFRHCGFTEL